MPSISGSESADGLVKDLGMETKGFVWLFVIFTVTAEKKADRVEIEGNKAGGVGCLNEGMSLKWQVLDFVLGGRRCSEIVFPKLSQ